MIHVTLSSNFLWGDLRNFPKDESADEYALSAPSPNTQTMTLILVNSGTVKLLQDRKKLPVL